MFNTKKTLIASAVAGAMIASGVALAMSGKPESGAAQAGNLITPDATKNPELTGVKGYPENWRQIIDQAGGKYLDAKVVKAILGDDDRMRLVEKMDPSNPYSFEVADSIDGGPHGNMQCKVPEAFIDVHARAQANYHNDTAFVAYGYGTPIAESALDIWKIHVDADGNGLPPLNVGMTIQKGGDLYIQFCAMCHGEFGEGAKGYLPLTEGDPLPLVTSDFNDSAPVKTIQNYWPYATTLFDYNRRAMPFWTPNMPMIGDAGYMGITGYILQMNGIVLDDKGTLIEDDDFFNAEMLMQANKYLPNAGNFFCDHRPVIANERCMKDCPDFMVGDGKGDIHNYRTALRLPDGTPQYNVHERVGVDAPGVGHHGF
jgi:S-disulfanyl-L-cysteine oxidoreductase SoxD